MNEERFVHEDHPGEEELRQRLEAYASVRLTPSRVASARIRAAIVEEARMRALESTMHGSQHRHRSGPRRMAALLLAAGLTLASAVAVAAGSAPGGPLYGARVWLETATLPADADARALERVRQIEERLVDTERAATAADDNGVAAAVQAYEAAVQSALDEAGTDTTRLERLKAALGVHVTVLETLVQDLPAAAQHGIDRAIEASQKAVNRIDDTQPSGGPDPAGNQPPGQSGNQNKPSNPPEHSMGPDRSESPDATNGAAP
ncbi:MAG: hypothetical protein HW391_36 [Chloroflexi bacterium]|nr:hypothetical protein [Chloroflexota bacterium]